jgi:hypothetical protein
MTHFGWKASSKENIKIQLQEAKEFKELLLAYYADAFVLPINIRDAQGRQEHYRRSAEAGGPFAKDFRKLELIEIAKIRGSEAGSLYQLANPNAITNLVTLRKVAEQSFNAEVKLGAIQLTKAMVDQIIGSTKQFHHLHLPSRSNSFKV